MNRLVGEAPDVKWWDQEAYVERFQVDARRLLQQYAERWIQDELEAELERWLGRRPHERRKQRSGRRIRVACRKCHSCYPRDFVRNGRRRRRLLTMFGLLTIWIPRVKCRCGGSVPIPFEVIRHRQRIWHDIRQQVQIWAERALSLRQMQEDLARVLASSIGLQTLNDRVHEVPILRPKHRPLSTVPPVVALDAIWTTCLRAQGATREDQLGRSRLVKRKKRATVLVALGIWPRTGRRWVLDWEIADGESQADWEKLLARLMERQLWPSRGLRLFLHDGGAGLKAALRRWYWEVPSQRCVFHKLRNVYHAISIPEESSAAQRRQLKRRLMRQAAAVFQATDRRQAEQLLAEFEHRWRDEQPEAVNTLLRDQEDTLRFHDYLEKNPNWQPRSLRTTSTLEGVNRPLRKQFRAAGAHHSSAGLEAAAARVLNPLLIL